MIDINNKDNMKNPNDSVLSDEEVDEIIKRAESQKCNQ